MGSVAGCVASGAVPPLPRASCSCRSAGTVNFPTNTAAPTRRATDGHDSTISSTGRVRRLDRTAVEILESVYQHRLLSTRQIHELHTPGATRRWTQYLLARLHHAGLVATVRLPGGLKLWYITEPGAEAVETIPSRAEQRRKLVSREQAAGPLQQHTLAVNHVGVAFVQAARERGDECGPLAWRHEIAHPLAPLPGRHTPEQLIADALLTYQRNEPTGRITFHYRFIELDRATMPVNDLAAKLARYAALYRRMLPATNSLELPVPLWTRMYVIFPAVMLVLAGASRQRLERRRDVVLALCARNPNLRDTPEVEIACCLLDDLTEQGPFAAIFRAPGDPQTATDWLGQNEDRSA